MVGWALFCQYNQITFGDFSVTKLKSPQNQNCLIIRFFNYFFLSFVWKKVFKVKVKIAATKWHLKSKLSDNEFLK